MTERVSREPNRLQRHKARTRAALVSAAQNFIAQGKMNVPILEITQVADVGMGSFYNHFQTREELFAAAAEDVLDLLGATLDELTEGLEDPAHIFTQSFRLTGRLHRRNPVLSKVLLSSGMSLARSGKGLALRARRDSETAASLGRFQVGDADLAMALATGAVLALGQLSHNHPERDDASSADQIAEDLLRIFGLSPEEAREICCRPLPSLDVLPRNDTAA
ncbi:TetR/AcrR family transcriptional regulator [Nocardia abscessus]|uniref:TetR/AcrR family transcriptional regulator n=1 Tax=Nocardia abscessus TaxID=120957 RepID=UPI00245899A8|nr:TetR/AcrR family transcriptional regulator [Nocardia abscessus]